MTETASGSNSESRRPGARRAAPAVLMDTNALFLPIRTGFPLEAEVARLVPGARLAIAGATDRELDRLVVRGTPGSAGARALARRFPIVPTDQEGDDGVLDAATRVRAILLTADRDLQARARSAGLAVLVPRDRHRLELQRESPVRRRRASSRGNG
jgi:rRNA-processing protein FCF1